MGQPASHIRALVSVPALLQIQRAADAPGKAEGGPSVWVPATPWVCWTEFLTLAELGQDLAVGGPLESKSARARFLYHSYF